MKQIDLSYNMLSFPRLSSRVFPFPCRAEKEQKEKMWRATRWAREICARWKDGRKRKKQSPLCPPGFQHPPLPLSSVLPSGCPLTSEGMDPGKGAELAAAAASAGRAWWPAAALESGITRTTGKRALSSASPARRSPSLCSADCRQFPGNRERMSFRKPGAWGGSRCPLWRPRGSSLLPRKEEELWEQQLRLGQRKFQDFQSFIKGCKSSSRVTSYILLQYHISRVTVFQ